MSEQDNSLLIENHEVTENVEVPEKNKRRVKRTFTFCVMKGNHPKQVKIGFENRQNWVEVNGKEDVSKANFLWKPTNFKFQDYMRIDEALKRGAKLVINHLDKIHGIATKTTLITSLKEYYKKSNDALH